jgi:predicted HD phosphohydrolase
MATHNRFKKRYQAITRSPHLRRQIAAEAARRMYDTIGPRPGEDTIALRDASESEYYAAKRRAAAVLGHRVRPGDLPSDSEVREEVLALARSRSSQPPVPSELEPDEDPPPLESLADHVDRFAIYKLRLQPLESVKQNPRTHPEGDALYHSLQVFELAREARPYDEEFLLAALLHDVGKAIDLQDRVGAGVEALRGAVTERTLWLIAHHKDLVTNRDRPSAARERKDLGRAHSYDDLTLLRDLDDAGRVPGMIVGTIDDALEYIRALEREDYLDG